VPVLQRDNAGKIAVQRMAANGICRTRNGRGSTGGRVSQLREQKKMSQRDNEERAGLERCYVSRVENGHTVPSLETLERFAGALGVPLY